LIVLRTPQPWLNNSGACERTLLIERSQKWVDPNAGVPFPFFPITHQQTVQHWPAQWCTYIYWKISPFPLKKDEKCLLMSFREKKRD
jgi:hypothetical protein